MARQRSTDRRVKQQKSHENDEQMKRLKKIDKSKSKGKQMLNLTFFTPKVCFQLLVIVFAIAFAVYTLYDVYKQLRVTTPLSVPKVISGWNATSNRFWGSYRPQSYFGLKARSPHSPVFGLMWFSQFRDMQEFSVRHWCEQGDNLPRYGWLAHDGINFGVQEIVDKEFMLTTSFVKRPDGEHGGDWAARIVAEPKVMEPQAKPPVISLLFYTALDGEGFLRPTIDRNILVSIDGFTEELGHFQMKFPIIERNHEILYNYYVSHVDGIDVLKETVLRGLKILPYKSGKQYIGLPGVDVHSSSAPTFIVHQVTAPVPFTMEVLFESASSMMEYEKEPLSNLVYDVLLQKYQNEFDKKFEKTFKLKKKGFDNDHVNFAKAALSNMLGGIGYFFGSSLVQSKYNKQPVPYWPAPLYSAVPSRTTFPRGFLWDEGFHNLLISQWNADISMDIIGHWLDLMNSDGWIPREVIHGAEARRKVPEEFVVQRDKNANPPTLFLPIRQMIDLENKDVDFLKRIYPRLEVWYWWFNSSQVGKLPGSYRWRGRNTTIQTEINPQTLTSGLDDYPRASHPTDDERHVDLRCWMALASGVMADIGKSLGYDYKKYEETFKYLSDNVLLDDLHWSEKLKAYSDYGLHTDNVMLKRPKSPPPEPGRPPPPPREIVRVITKDQPTLQHVNQFGYVSLFPFLLQILDPSSPKLEQILHDVRDESKMWTPFGLRSLSKTAPLYMKKNTEHNHPYWRGPIWINMNFLALRALNFYMNTEGPYSKTAAELYTSLRSNLVENMYREYRTTGYIWEQYNDSTGKGQGSHPFTGWSSLVVLIMADSY